MSWASSFRFRASKAEHRKYLKNKVWRAKVSSSDSGAIVTRLCVLWALFPVEELWHTFEFLDEKGSLLLDIACPGSDPLQKSQRHMAGRLMSPAKDTDLGTLWHHFALDSSDLLVAKTKLFSTSVSLCCQLWWRFETVYQDWPFRLARCLFMNTAEALKELEAFFLIFRSVVWNLCALPNSG